MLSRPRVNSMKKKIRDQKGAAGIIARPAGYATKTRPGPERESSS